MKKRYLSTVAAALLAAIGSTHAGDLTVTVENIQNDDGQVMLGLFDSAPAFPKQAVRGQSIAAGQRDAAGKLRFVFAGLAAGTYAVSAFHDRDNSGKLNTNLLGIPSEPYGFSGKPSGRIGPPTFADVSIDVPEAGMSLDIGVK